MRGGGIARAEAAAIALSQRVAFVGVAGMLVIGVLTALDVIVLRTVFNAPIPGSNELLSTIFAVAIAAVLSSGLAQRASLEIDFLEKLVGGAVSAWLRIVGNTLYLLVLCIAAWRIVVHTVNAFEIGKVTIVLQWPMWPFLTVIALFFAICVPIQLIVVLSMIAERMGLKAAPNRAEQPSPAGAPGGAARIAGAFAIVVTVAVGLAAAAWSGIATWQDSLANYGTALSVFFFLLLWLLIFLFVPLSAALMICGLLGAGALMGFDAALSVVGSETVGLITNEDLAVLPLFMMMGAFATVAGLSADIYRLAQASVGFLRGGLALATIGGCAGFGALTGSSLATIATIGTVSLPEMQRRGYSRELASGTVAAGGTLGQLIPPSTAIVLYAILVEQSIGTLYIAVLVPAVMTVLLYGAAVLVQVWVRPAAAPGRSMFDPAEFGRALLNCGGVFVMFGTVIGGIYTGIFTATEAAAVGATIAFLIALWRGKLNRGALWQVVGETTRSTSMLYFVIIGAMIASFFFGTSGLASKLLGALTGSGLSSLSVIVLMVVAFIVFGTVMDSFTIMIITAGLATAIVQDLGYDPIWWGVMMVILVELGVVTPPFGLNLFMMKALAPEIGLLPIMRGVLPFIVADIVKIALLIAFPALVLWLPKLAFG